MTGPEPGGTAPGGAGTPVDATGPGREPVLRVSRRRYPVTVLGVGRRLAVWTQGCDLGCAGCMSPFTWDGDGGEDVPVPTLADLWAQALADGADGLTVSGGEPLAQPEALGAFLAVAAELRDAAVAPGGTAAGRDVDLLVYTGLEPAELPGLPVADPPAGLVTPAPGSDQAGDRRVRALAGADALITGRYRADAPTTLVWRGSANQRLLALTPLGARRYGQHVDRCTLTPAIQLDLTADGTAEIVGIPHPGTLRALAQELRADGSTARPNWIGDHRPGHVGPAR